MSSFLDMDQLLFYILIVVSIGTGVTFIFGRRTNKKITQAIYSSAWDYLKKHCQSETANFKRTWHGIIKGTFLLRRDAPIQAMEISLSLLSRDIGLGYIPSKIIKKIDRLYFLASLPNTPEFDMVLVSWDSHKLDPMIKKLHPMLLEDKASVKNFNIYSSDSDFLSQFIIKRFNQKNDCLENNLKELMVSRDNATIYALCNAKMECVKPMLETIFDLARFSVKKIKKKRYKKR